MPRSGCGRKGEDVIAVVRDHHLATLRNRLSGGGIHRSATTGPESTIDVTKVIDSLIVNKGKEVNDETSMTS